jgi:CRP/FNR family transcriptional regulator
MMGLEGRGADMADWIDGFRELARLDGEDRAFLLERARVVKLDAGQPVFAPGRRPEAFLLLLEGTVVVHQFGSNGREIVLYRVSGGESCIMTTACLLSDEDYLAEGITESPVTAVALGEADFNTLIARSPAFRRLVFSKYASRVTRLMEVLEDVAFERLDRRLARKLLELASGSATVEATHQGLATELGSAREVISRQIKEFARRGWVESGRGHIQLTDRDALAAMASEA